MPINGTELINNPFDTIFSPFTDVLGQGFWLAPLTFIAIALYIKTRDVVVVSAWMLGSGTLFSSALIFADFPEMAFVYLIFTTIGLIGMIVGIFFPKEW